MRDWIKNHPWRMEIIPLIAFLMTVVFPLLYLDVAAPQMKPRHGFSPSQTWLLTYLTLVLAMLFVLLFNFVFIQAHIVGERETKRFNIWAIICNVETVVTGMAGSLLLTWRVCPWWMLLLWMILAITSAVIPRKLEEARQFHPKQTIPDIDVIIPPETTSQGACLYYREVIGKKSVLPLYFVMIGCLWFMWWEEAISFATIVWVLGVILLGIFANIRKTTFTITNECISIQWPAIRRATTIPFEAVKCCSVEVKDPNDSRRIIRSAQERTIEVVDLRSTSIVSEMMGSYQPDIHLKVETTGKYDYTFGLHDPEKACAVINALISARED